MSVNATSDTKTPIRLMMRRPRNKIIALENKKIYTGTDEAVYIKVKKRNASVAIFLFLIL